MVDPNASAAASTSRPLKRKFFELNNSPYRPTPTYRHLLSPTALTPWNPLRVVAHCDIDAAYAQFEAVRIGSPDDQPLIVIQWDTIIAVNYPARKYGITRCKGMGSEEARRLCPHVTIAHTATYRPGEDESGYWEDANVLTHKVSLDPYRRESMKIMAIFRELVPTGEVEKASIDEAYMDLTPPVIARLLTLHPHLATVPPDAPEGLDTPLPPAPPLDWTRAGNIIPNHQELAALYPPDDETSSQISDTEGLGDEEEPEQEAHKPIDHGAVALEKDGEVGDATWEDWALCMGAEIMAQVRAQVWERLHYTCSAGIAHNKAMAKLCSSYRKPMNQTVLRHSAVPAFLHDKEFTDIRNLGGKLGYCIAEEFQVKTVGDLMKIPLEDIQSRFGEESIWVYNIIRGIDHTDLTARHVTKSMIASKNIIPPVKTSSAALNWIDLLAGELAVRLRESREIAPGLWPKTLVLSYRTGFGYVSSTTRSRQVPFPFTKDLTGGYIGRYGRRMWNEVAPGLEREGMDVHNFHNLERMEEGQRNIEGFLRGNYDSSSTTGELSAKKRSRSKSPQRPNQINTNSDKSIIGEDAGDSWTCPKCRKRISVAPGIGADDIASEMVLRKQEHQDYHFALELNDIGRPKIERPDANRRRSPRPPDGAVAKAKKKEKEKGGIKAFFAPAPKAKVEH